MKILIFGGTGDARELANGLVAEGHQVTTSLAGRTEHPVRPEGEVRVGGFGGVENISAYIAENGFDWLIDATHPYAQRMSEQLAEAVRQTPMPFMRMVRAPWEQGDGVTWQDMPDIAGAITQLPEGARALVTTGHFAIETLETRPDCVFYLRLIEKPQVPIAENTTLIVERPPYDVHSELSLMREFSVTHVLAKNSGGNQTRTKLDAAAQLGVEIFMVVRPALPAVEHEVRSVNAAMRLVQDSTA